MTPCVGIDLGTTCSAIGLVTEGVPRILAVDGGELVPSVAWYGDGGPLVGQAAANSLALAPELGVVSSKRHMGSSHRWQLGDEVVGPVDVAAKILGHLADAAAGHLGARPGRAVVTVPAWFTNVQRQDTRRAAELAGLHVERLLNEPTAAALAHAHGFDGRRRALVYDLGGGTFDVSLVEQDGPVVEVLASHGDTRLGGDDLDEALAGRVLGRAGDPALAEAVRASPAARLRLGIAVEQAKRDLGERLAVTVRVPFLVEHGGERRHLEVELTRADVDEELAPLLERTLQAVDRVLADSGTTPDQLDELVLVGGSTLLPQVWHALHDRYGLQGSHAVPPRRAVVLGAALQAALVDGSQVHGVLVDVAPYALSAGALHDTGLSSIYACRVITPRNTPLPSRHVERFYTSHPRARSVEVPIFQGGDPDPDANVLLAQVRMEGLPPAPAGQGTRPIAVEFQHDLNGLVSISVTDELSGKREQATVMADAQGVEEAWEELRRDLVADGLMPESPHATARPSSSSPTHAPEPELLELLDVVPGAEEALRAEHPALVDELLELARQGNEARASGDLDRAGELADTLGDRLFEEGIYL